MPANWGRIRGKLGQMRNNRKGETVYDTLLSAELLWFNFF
jgi:hypothetical protein